MCIGEISDFDNDKDDMYFNRCETVCWNGKQLKLLDGERNNNTTFTQIISESTERFSSARMKPMNSVGGSVAAEKDEDGNSEIAAKVHMTVKSDDGNTVVMVSGGAAVDNQGNCLGKVEGSVEHEF